MNSAEYKESFMKMASSAISASKTGWTRARQFTEERLGGAEKTEYDAQFENLSLRAERTKVNTEKLLKNFESVLQPNPGIRMEEFLYEQLDKRNPCRPTNAFSLGQVMQDASQDIGPGTAYGSTLSKVGSTMKKMGNTEKDFMQQSMSHVIHPLKSFLDNEMKTITKEKRLLEVRRLDLDACKAKVKKSATADKMRQGEIELRQAQSDYDRQYEITKLLLEGVSASHNNHLSALKSFVEAMGMYHGHCQQYVTELQTELNLGPTEPPRPVLPSAPSFNDSSAKRAKVLHDYDASDRTELSLLADEIVTVYQSDELNDDWIMAERGNQKGKVPVIFLEML